MQNLDSSIYDNYHKSFSLQSSYFKDEMDWSISNNFNDNQQDNIETNDHPYSNRIPQDQWTNNNRILISRKTSCIPSLGHTQISNNNKNRVSIGEKKPSITIANSSEFCKNLQEKSRNCDLDQKDIEFIEETRHIFKLPSDYRNWTNENIENWLYWIRHKLRFKFPKLSKEIIDFRKEEFQAIEVWQKKFGDDAGGCMFKHFKMWLKYHQIKSKSDIGRKHGNEYNKSPADKPRRRNEKKDGLYLWQVLLTMLFSKLCSPYIHWTDYESGMFKIKDPHAVSVIWGESKGNRNMTYDKMSRSMRQYYKSNLLKKTNHDKLNYCFNMDDNSVKKFIKRCSERLPDIKIPSHLHQLSNS